MRTHYDVLQIAETASPEVIRGAYRYLSEHWHPDKNPNRREEAERMMKDVNVAYAVLSNPQTRSAYDRELADERAEGRASDGASNDQSSDAQRKEVNAMRAYAIAKARRPLYLVVAFFGLSLAIGFFAGLFGLENLGDARYVVILIMLAASWEISSAYINKRRADILASISDGALATLYEQQQRRKTVQQIILGVTVVVGLIAAVSVSALRENAAVEIASGSSGVEAGGQALDNDLRVADRAGTLPGGVSNDGLQRGNSELEIPLQPTEENTATPAETKPESILFENRCSARLNLALAYEDLNGREVVSGFWDIDRGQTVFLRTATSMLRTRSRLVYVYAESPSLGIQWAGDPDNPADRTITMGENQHRFFASQLSDADGQGLKLSLACDGYRER